MKKLIYLLMFGACVCLMGACTSEEADIVVEPEEEVEEVDVPEVVELVLNSKESAAAEQVQEFNYKFFKAVVANNPEKANVVCSPLSASTVLSMVANTAEGQLAEEIVAALDCRDIESLNSLSKKYIYALPTIDEAVPFRLVNSVWYDNTYTINPDFAKIAKDYFGAANFASDFKGAPTKVVSDINGWVKDNTNGIIPQIIKNLPAEAQAVLVNALYFKGAWTNPFDEKDTYEDTFKGVNGTHKVKMMHNESFQHFVDAENYKMVKMQVGNGFFEALFILPANDVDTFIANADFAAIANAEHTDKAIDFMLPRFKYNEYEAVELNPVMKALGINSISEPSLSKIFTSVEKSSNRILQNSGIEFTEKGAEGASASYNIPGGCSNWHPLLPEVKFDRPFVFIIRETTTGAMLFAGKISDL